MSKIKLLALAAALSCGLFTAQAQISIPTQQITLGGSNIDLTIDTNWAAIPYGIYDTTDKKWGYGGALLYQVTPYFWTGVRADQVNGYSTSAGVQVNLQASVTWDGIVITPFADASTGLGDSSMYASAGAGGVINFHTWSFKLGPTAVSLSAGVAASYEHVVNNNRKWNQIVGGPLIQLTF